MFEDVYDSWAWWTNDYDLIPFRRDPWPAVDSMISDRDDILILHFDKYVNNYVLPMILYRCIINRNFLVREGRRRSLIKGHDRNVYNFLTCFEWKMNEWNCILYCFYNTAIAVEY